MKGRYLWSVLSIATEYSALQNNETMKLPGVFLNYTVLTEILKTSLLEETVSSSVYRKKKSSAKRVST